MVSGCLHLKSLGAGSVGALSLRCQYHCPVSFVDLGLCIFLFSTSFCFKRTKFKKPEMCYFLNYRVCIVENRGKAILNIYKRNRCQGERGMTWKDEKIGKMLFAFFSMKSVLLRATVSSGNKKVWKH